MPDLDALANRLHTATQRFEVISPFTDEDPTLDIQSAYGIQDRLLQLRTNAGELLVGAKVGLVSRAVQSQLGVTEPVHGWLTDAMVVDDGAQLDIGHFLQPRVEPEITFILDRDLDDPDTTTAAVLAATAAVLPALEVLDCHFADYRVRPADIIAENSLAARFVLGPTPVEIGALDLRTLGCVFEMNDELVATATGAEVLGDPAAAVACLVRQLAARGRGIESGMVVLSGGLTRSVRVRAGDAVTAHFDHLGSVRLHCR